MKAHLADPAPANHSPVAPTLQDGLADLESAVLQACALINLITAKLSLIMDEYDTDGKPSGMVAAGLVNMSGDTVNKLSSAYEAVHQSHNKAKSILPFS